MTIQELSDKFSKFTGIRKDIGALIEGASTNDEKKKVYDHLMWHLRRGRILERPWDKELFEAIVPALQEALNIEQSTIDDITEETYTAETAAAYNLTLDGALQYGAVKTPAVEAVEAQEAVLYEDAEEYNTDKGTELTDEQFEALDEEEKIKTPAVEAVEAQDAVLYTDEEVDAYNATLPGAVKAGDTIVNG